MCILGLIVYVLFKQLRLNKIIYFYLFWSGLWPVVHCFWNGIDLFLLAVTFKMINVYYLLFDSSA